MKSNRIRNLRNNRQIEIIVRSIEKKKLFLLYIKVWLFSTSSNHFRNLQFSYHSFVECQLCFVTPDKLIRVWRMIHSNQNVCM